MKIMSINSGSSSLKFKLFEMPEEKVITEGVFERITFKEEGIYTIKINGEKIKEFLPLPNHAVAVERLLKDLVDRKIISSLSEIKGVGHRIVQGGKYFDKSVLVDSWAKDRIRELIDLAPLHNGPHLIGIEAFEKALPNVKQVVVFDTAFHQGMEPEAFMYAVPYYWYTDYGIRKYGAHGTSHQFVANEYARLTNQDINKLKIVTCHLGNGCSLCAIENGRCKDTSMGLTPLEGVPMGTRTGNIDPTVVSYIVEKEGKTAWEVVNELNKKSGYLGISGISNDARDLEDAMAEGNERATLAIKIQEKRIADYIGSYYLYLEGIDAIIFTAGIGENAKEYRERICKRLEILGVVIDDEANSQRGYPFRISAPSSKIDVWVVPTNEELVIARDTMRLINE
ncbi:MAG: acetate kinase [Bacillales bacterium]|nr:acetate kinase [Bacillales bacterium]